MGTLSQNVIRIDPKVFRHRKSAPSQNEFLQEIQKSFLKAPSELRVPAEKDNAAR